MYAKIHSFSQMKNTVADGTENFVQERLKNEYQKGKCLSKHKRPILLEYSL